MKLNSDIAVCPNESFIAILAKNFLSSLYIAYMERLAAINPLIGEACALAVAMDFAWAKKRAKIEFECDSLVLCKEHLSSSLPSWCIASLVESIMDGLQEFRE